MNGDLWKRRGRLCEGGVDDNQKGAGRSVQAGEGVLCRKGIVVRRSMLRCGPALPGRRRQQLMARGEAGAVTPSLLCLTSSHTHSNPAEPWAELWPSSASSVLSFSLARAREPQGERSGLPHTYSRG